MKVLLLSGDEHLYITDYYEKRRHTVVNRDPLTINRLSEYMTNHDMSFDAIVITDGALTADPDENERYISFLSERFSNIYVVTRDFFFESPNNGVTVIISDWLRITEEDINRTLKPQQEEFHSVTKGEKDKKERKKWGIRSKLPVNTDDLSDTTNIDRTSSRAAIFTGHRGSGLTSTAICVALSAVNRNLKTIYIDLDTDYRAANLYLGQFGTQADKEDNISSSLIRLLAQPQKYDLYAVNADGLWVTSLGYGFNEKKLLQQHFTESKLIGLITSLKHHFDLVVVDFPLDSMALFPAVLNNTDILALCMENSIYSAFTTIRNVVNGFEDVGIISYFASKAKLVVTKYNDESIYEGEPISPERLSELIVNEGFCDAFSTEMFVAGSIPYENRFDRQIESDVSIIYTDNRMKQAYDSILLRLIGAVR